ncbi:MAG: 1-acyl-sn-glycerol-3-phosphate acyltransferase [Caldilineaceae bacterium]|nr:1-acyl-sn-glycerol-3-phosphate acyltransferase [Caldilineaceae bacterium]MCB9137991.1 1-acyl-sn-glycerol-3-phosphate acyltransferase [Caldilineaceae bacterium]
MDVVGLYNVPETRPLIVISNHFSWFDAALITLYLPFRPVFLIATESQRFWFVRLFMSAFQGIPIWRGGVDRDALRRALETLKTGQSLAIFPEGGIDPRKAAQRARGELVEESVTNDYSHNARLDAQLTHAQPGTAFLAVQSGVPILPVALIGTEQILTNLMRLRRTPVTVRVGKPFGPLAVDKSMSRAERRQRIDEMGEEIMVNIAALFPEENRGPFRNASVNRRLRRRAERGQA